MAANKNGSNVLHMAVKLKLSHIVNFLLEVGFPHDIQKANGVTAIGIAALTG